MKLFAKITQLGLVLATLISASNAFAWGAEGHRITGTIATQFLTPKAKTKLAAILPGIDLAKTATWMDEQRPALLDFDKNSGDWHFDDVPVCGDAAYCTDGNCASRKSIKYLGILGDSHSTNAERLQALRFVVHMVGDLHQPLHAADHEDRGGNLVFVKLGGPNGGQQIKLHHAWDTELLLKVKGTRSESVFAKALVTQFSAKAAESKTGKLSDWIAQSHKLAVESVYPQLDGFACNTQPEDGQELSSEYQTKAGEIISLQLFRAGLRIAVLLNKVLQ